MEYVLMAIPAELVPKVAALITGFDVAGAPLGATSPTGSAGLINGWTEDLVRQAFKESADPMRRVLLFLAEHGGEEVTSTEIADAIDAERGWNTVAGMLGAFGRRSANRYKRRFPMWSSREGEDGASLFKVPVAVAEAIKVAAEE
ncbi:MAG: DUF6416 domain-containing protein [Solirubrobacteraceae bacterium]